MGVVSAQMTVTISNTGTAPLHIGSPTVTGANPNDYSISSNGCTSAVPVSQSCAIQIIFSPQALGASSATLNIGSDALNGTQIVALSGTGVGAIASISPSTRDFGSVLVGLSSNTMNYTVSNTGTAPLQVGTVSFSGQNPTNFVVVNNGCSSAVAPSQSCTIGVQFKPKSPVNVLEQRSATLNVPSNAINGTRTAGATGTALGL